MEKIFCKLNSFFRGEWSLAVLDLESGRWLIPPKASNINYLKYQNTCGRHILMQPERQENYLLIDDASRQIISRHHHNPGGHWKPGRMVVETSPDNYQVWVRSSRPLPLDEKRYWLAKLHNDPGADPNNRWGRCPGFRNRKEKHQNQHGKYPLSRLVWVDWKQQAGIPLHKHEKKIKTFSPLPQRGGVCRFKSITRSDYEKGNNNSATDFAYSMALGRRKISIDEIKQRILSERIDWTNHQSERKRLEYLERTVRKALSIIQQT